MGLGWALVNNVVNPLEVANGYLDGATEQEMAYPKQFGMVNETYEASFKGNCISQVVMPVCVHRRCKVGSSSIICAPKSASASSAPVASHALKFMRGGRVAELVP
jgi:hypothetical protein